MPAGLTGCDRHCAVNLDTIYTIALEELGPQIGSLAREQDSALAAAVFHAVGLDW